MFKKFRIGAIGAIIALAILFVVSLFYSVITNHAFAVKSAAVIEKFLAEDSPEQHPLYLYKSIIKMRKDYAERITRDTNKSPDEYMSKEDTLKFADSRGFKFDRMHQSYDYTGVYDEYYRIKNGDKRNGAHWDLYFADGTIIARLPYYHLEDEYKDPDSGESLDIYFIEADALATTAVEEVFTPYDICNGVLVKVVDKIDYELLSSLNSEAIHTICGDKIITDKDPDYINGVIKEIFGDEALAEDTVIYHSADDIRLDFSKDLDVDLDDYMTKKDTISLLSDRGIYDERKDFNNIGNIYASLFNNYSADYRYQLGWKILSSNGHLIALPAFYDAGVGKASHLFFVEEDAISTYGLNALKDYYEDGVIIKVVDEIDLELLDYLTYEVIDTLYKSVTQDM